jgi:hypothetical protein
MQHVVNIVGTLFVAALLSVGVAAAATLQIGTRQLAAGKTPVASCTTSALTATRDVDASGNVTQVTVTNVPQACSGQILSLALRGAGGASLGSASATIGSCTGGCSVPFTSFGTTVAAQSLLGYSFSVRS